MNTTVSKRPGEHESDRHRRRKPHLFLLHSPGERPVVAKRTLIKAPGCYAIGREPEQDPRIFLQGDRCASRTHAFIEVSALDGSMQVRDAGSRNGTFLNGGRLPVGERRALREGDILRLGDSFFLYREQVDSADAEEVEELVGVSTAIRQLRNTVARLARDPASVLLLGETGSGKEVVASALHRLSGRLGRRVAVNCAAVPENLAESQFFGHTRGAFTGATPQTGYFLAAHGGTLILDEVGDLSLALQAKLLRAIEEGAVMPVGSTELVPCRFRLIAATNQDLEAALAAGRFREDLYARLTDVVLHLPPLRARKEDILLLLEHASGGRLPELSADFVELLLAYHWPRNVREIYKVQSHLRLFGQDAALKARLTGLGTAAAPPPAPAAAVQVAETAAELDAAEGAGSNRPTPPSKTTLEELMHKHRGVIQDVADELGYSRRQVGRWLTLHQIDRRRYRALGAPTGSPRA